MTAIIRTTTSGSVAGLRRAGGGLHWLGIPFAQPPIGPLRWRAPRASLKWMGVRSARAPGSPCWQMPFFGSGQAANPIGGEDCLYLNIWAPAGAGREALRPVMVWIHGGSNAKGQGAGFDGRHLADQQHVIVVTVNYRLGPFGWFLHTAINAGEDAIERSGNYGTLDLIMALGWVRDNIAEFGGDPGSVTIFGESAGGWNVASLLVSPLARGLFHRAIIQSGLLATSTRAEAGLGKEEGGSDRSGAEYLRHLLVARGAAADRGSALRLAREMSTEAKAAFLRGCAFSDFVEAARLIEAGGAPRYDLFPGIIADGAVIPEEGIRQSMERGRAHRVPMIIGCTRDECSILLPMLDRHPELIRRREDGSGFIVADGPGFARAVRRESDAFFLRNVMRPALALAEAAPGSIFTYRFDWDQLAESPFLDGHPLGATHGLDLPFVFGSWDVEGLSLHRALLTSDARRSFGRLSPHIMAYWAEFARTGRPGKGRGASPEWLPLRPDDPATLLLDDMIGRPSRMVSLADLPLSGGRSEAPVGGTLFTA